MAAGAAFDVLVIGSGASGLAAAVSAERAGARVARRDQGLAPGEQLRRRRRAGSRRRSATTTRPSSTPRTSGAPRTRPPTAARRGPDRRGAGRDPLARGARRRVHARERRLPPRALRRRLAEAPPPGRRPHRPRDHEGAARGLGGRLAARRSRTRRSASLEPRRRAAGAPTCGEHDDRRRAPSSSPPAAAATPRRRRAASSRRTIPNATGEVTRIALDARRRGARPRRAPVPPERRRLAREHAGLLDPRDDARLRRRAPERRRRGVHRLARPARRRQRRRSSTRSRPGAASRRPTAGPAVYLDTTRISEADAEVSLPYMLRRYRARGHRPARASRSSPTPSSTTRTAAS